MVRTKEELAAAKDQKYQEILVQGTLADDLKKSKKIALASGTVAVLLVAALAAIPFTAGISTLGLASVATLTGMELVAVIAAVTVGLTLIIAVFKDYEEIYFKNGELKLRRKSSQA